MKLILVLANILFAVILYFGSNIVIVSQMSYLHGVHYQMMDRKQFNPDLSKDDIEKIRQDLISAGPIKGNVSMMANVCSFIFIINAVCIMVFWPKRKLA